MAGTLPILQIRSSILLVGLLTAIPMTYYNEGKIFKIFRFLTHPTTDRSHCKKPPEFVVTESSTINQDTENLEPIIEYEESSSSKVQGVSGSLSKCLSVLFRLESNLLAKTGPIFFH